MSPINFGIVAQKSETEFECIKKSRKRLPRKNGKGFEDRIRIIFMNINIELRRFEPKIVREFEGVLSRFGKIETIGILIAPSKNNFTQKLLDRVESSEFNLILTDELCLSLDLIQFVESK
ncbi:17084_t:CDS:2 [Gigaspora margarita]|uniref:17084_t:CDS:1 n=1 Tax=Gigaspora margarita TaxID=4874 RepID=A0ABM8VZP5_GIGMA|nr:17084_t:CDS:2 [Gigaspora margarita]